MRIKTFEASTMQEALALVKGELGEDAVVLNTKHVKPGGILGLRGGTRVEVMAAVDEETAAAAVGAQVAAQVASRPEPVPVAQMALHTPAASFQSAARAYGGVTTPPVEIDSELLSLRTEVKQLAALVNTLLPQRPSTPISDKPLLVRLGVEEDIARAMLLELMSIEDPSALTSALAARMEAFATPPVLDGHKVITVVGPTGVGKTTTLAKLAARFSLEQGKSVALVTADTFRIGAVEQLRTYARIMGLPLETALTPEDVAAEVRKHADKDVVLVDTVGRSQRSEEHLRELKAFVDAASPTETHLVVAASLGAEIQTEVVSSFAMFAPTRLIVTKLDECSNAGCLVNLPLRASLAISCLTAGQNVPQDIEFADAGRIAREVVGVA